MLDSFDHCVSVIMVLHFNSRRLMCVLHFHAIFNVYLYYNHCILYQINCNLFLIKVVYVSFLNQYI